MNWYWCSKCDVIFEKDEEEENKRLKLGICEDCEEVDLSDIDRLWLTEEDLTEGEKE